MTRATGAIKGGLFLALVLVCLSAGTALACHATIGDFVWHDLDADGIQDAGEPGIAAVTVKLRKCSDNSVVGTTTTNASGYYSFGVSPGNYYVEFTPPAGYYFSPQDQGTNDCVDSDADPSTGRTVCTSLTDGENDRSWDAGLCRLASVSDFVWLDSNRNGIQDAGEAGFGGVTVELYRCEGNLVASTTTNSTGYYIFSGLEPGSYYLRFILPAGYSFSPANQGGDDTLDSDVDPTTGTTDCMELAAGQNDVTWDAGIYRSPPSVPASSPWGIAGLATALGLLAIFILKRRAESRGS